MIRWRRPAPRLLCWLVCLCSLLYIRHKNGLEPSRGFSDDSESDDYLHIQQQPQLGFSWSPFGGSSQPKPTPTPNPTPPPSLQPPFGNPSIPGGGGGVPPAPYHHHQHQQQQQQQLHPNSFQPASFAAQGSYSNIVPPTNMPHAAPSPLPNVVPPPHIPSAIPHHIEPGRGEEDRTRLRQDTGEHRHFPKELGIRPEALTGKGFDADAYRKLGGAAYTYLQKTGVFSVNSTSTSNLLRTVPDRILALIKAYPEIAIVIAAIQRDLAARVQMGQYMVAEKRKKQLALIVQDLADQFRFRLRHTSDINLKRVDAEIVKLLKASRELLSMEPSDMEAISVGMDMMREKVLEDLQEIAGKPRIVDGHLITPLPPSGFYRTPFVGVVPRLVNTTTGVPRLDSLLWPRQILMKYRCGKGILAALDSATNAATGAASESSSSSASSSSSLKQLMGGPPQGIDNVVGGMSSESATMLVCGAQLERPKGYWLYRYRHILEDLVVGKGEEGGGGGVEGKKRQTNGIPPPEGMRDLDYELEQLAVAATDDDEDDRRIKQLDLLWDSALAPDKGVGGKARWHSGFGRRNTDADDGDDEERKVTTASSSSLPSKSSPLRLLSKEQGLYPRLTGPLSEFSKARKVGPLLQLHEQHERKRSEKRRRQRQHSWGSLDFIQRPDSGSFSEKVWERIFKKPYTYADRMEVRELVENRIPPPSSAAAGGEATTTDAVRRRGQHHQQYPPIIPFPPLPSKANKYYRLQANDSRTPNYIRFIEDVERFLPQ